MKEFDKLYGIPSNGKKIKEWSISVYQETEGNSAFIKRIHGYQGCKMQENIKEISKGKNIGKKNETTPLQQALNEAQSLWKKQKESGYSENVNEIEKSTTILPMLAFDYNKRGKDIKFPCFIQPKLDGVRLLIKVNHKNIECYSRTGKRFEYLKHIEKDIRNMYTELKLEKEIFIDGELFTTEIPFEEISGLCRKQEKVDELTKLQFHIFDTFNIEELDRPFTDRINDIECFSKLIKKHKNLDFYHS